MDLDGQTSHDAVLRRARRMLSDAHNVCVLTGAGISTDAGIPDFRGPEGLWTKNPGAERASTIANYLRDTEARKAAWRMRLDDRLINARPTAGHDALVELERQGRLEHLVTQNIDGLHQRAGTSRDRLTEIHGSVDGFECVSCGAGGPIATIVDRVREGEEDPRCTQCSGILKTTVVMFGEMLPEGAMERAEAAVDAADVFLAVGTTLEVSPVNGMAFRALRRRIPVVVVNLGPTAADSFASVKVEAPIGEVLAELVSR